MPKFTVTTPGKVLGKRCQTGEIVDLEASAAEPYLADGVLEEVALTEGETTTPSKPAAAKPATAKKK